MAVANGGNWGWMAATDDSGQRQWMVDKVTGERKDWCEKRRKLVGGDKIEGKKIGIIF